MKSELKDLQLGFERLAVACRKTEKSLSSAVAKISELDKAIGSKATEQPDFKFVKENDCE